MDFFLKNNKRKCPFIRDLFKSTLNNNDYFKNFAFPPLVSHGLHTIYTRNNMGHKCEGNCGLLVLNEILKKTYPEYLKKIVGAVWKLPAK